MRYYHNRETLIHEKFPTRKELQENLNWNILGKDRDKVNKDEMHMISKSIVIKW